jgi:chromosome segregation ATPase
MFTSQELAETTTSLREQIQQARVPLLDAGAPAGVQSHLVESLERIVEMATKDPWTDTPLLEHLSSAVEESLKLWRTEFSHSVSQLNEIFPAVQGSLETVSRLREQLSEELKAVELQRQDLCSKVEQTHALQLRLGRQRKALAQSLRAQRAELQLKASRLQQDLDNRLVSEIRSERKRYEAEKSELNQQLEAAHKQVAELIDKTSQLESRETQLEMARREIENLQTQLAQSHQSARDSVDSNDLRQHQADLENDQENQRLQSALAKAEAELSDLRRQNSELAAKIAQQTTDKASARNTHGTASQELLTWEERKKLILQQLEMETKSDSDHTHEQRLEVQKIIETTEFEIARRDREIEELRAIVQTQSDAREGLAIGAAGVAQILDADELISAERQKLRQIQQEWEAKLRQAEIDLSMERAKLARERAELDMQKPQPPASGSPTTSTDRQQRRWLDFLGLKEETTE